MSQDHSPATTRPGARQGISNRESAADEAQERLDHPPLDTDSPPPEDAAGGVGEQPLDDLAGSQTSRKSGIRSSAQKAEQSRDPERPVPPSRKVAGAFGKEQG